MKVKEWLRWPLFLVWNGITLCSITSRSGIFKVNYIQSIYKESLALLTDFYQLTMANGYFQKGMKDRESVFNLFFRENPYQGGYAVMSGLSLAMDYLEHFKFKKEDIEYLCELKGPEGRAVFQEDFLEYLAGMDFSCDVDAFREGSLIFPHEPVVRIRGPVIQCQLLETALLTLIGHGSLIATKASRIVAAAKGEPVMEFGLRRSHGIDGAITSSLAAFIGGCHSTSNVLAGKLFGIPVAGTHAHSWVMAFDSELEAFRAYADSMPDNCVLLVDTYDTRQGVRNAIEIGKELRQNGRELRAIRIDSGDLAYLSIQAREMLDEAGLKATEIVGSNDLDEYLITSLKEQGARISMWGVGTKLITSFDQPALGMVYKLAALQDPDIGWVDKVKLSEQASKINVPGMLNVRRFYQDDKMIGDMIFDERDEVESNQIIAPEDFTKSKRFRKGTDHKDLLIPLFRKGQKLVDLPGPDEARGFHLNELKKLDPTSRRLVNPHSYPVGLEKKLFDRRASLILKYRNETD